MWKFADEGGTDDGDRLSSSLKAEKGSSECVRSFSKNAAGSAGFNDLNT